MKDKSLNHVSKCFYDWNCVLTRCACCARPSWDTLNTFLSGRALRSEARWSWGTSISWNARWTRLTRKASFPFHLKRALLSAFRLWDWWTLDLNQIQLMMNDPYGGSFRSRNSRLSITARSAIQTRQTWWSGETGVTFLSSNSRHCYSISWGSLLSRVSRWSLKSRDTLDITGERRDDSLVSGVLNWSKTFKVAKI